MRLVVIVAMFAFAGCHSSCTEENGAPPVVEADAAAPATPIANPRGTFSRVRPTMRPIAAPQNVAAPAQQNDN